MKIYNLFHIFVFVLISIFPLNLGSADIYKKSEGSVKMLGTLNPSFIVDDGKLNSTLFVVRSKEKLEDLFVISGCKNEQKVIFEEQVNDYYLYGVYFKINESCSEEGFYLKNGDIVFTDSNFKIKIFSDYELFDKYSNYSDIYLNSVIDNTNISNIEITDKLTNSKSIDIKSALERLQLRYKKSQNEYMLIFLNKIKDTRSNLKYISPVYSKSIPVRSGIIPNAARPYRLKYTHGVHQGWYVFAAKGTPVIALGEGIIIRVKNDFEWSNFDNVLWQNLSDDDKLTNLDIFRGNQVWLKTADGNVTFYSHLSPEIKVEKGQFVKKGDVLGFVDSTGVPDKGYSAYHLHFEIQVNPHTSDNTSELDIMRWPYFGKGMTSYQVVIAQQKIFNGNEIAKY